MAAAGDLVFDALDERRADPLPSKYRIDEDRKQRGAIAIDAGSYGDVGEPQPEDRRAVPGADGDRLYFAVVAVGEDAAVPARGRGDDDMPETSFATARPASVLVRRSIDSMDVGPG